MKVWVCYVCTGSGTYEQTTVHTTEVAATADLITFLRWRWDDLDDDPCPESEQDLIDQMKEIDSGDSWRVVECDLDSPLDLDKWTK